MKALPFETHPHSTLLLRDDGVAVLTVANGSKLNLLDPTTIDELTATIGQIARRDDIRAIVLAGSGERACFGGADMRHMMTVDGEGGRAFLTQLHDLCEAVRRFPVPVIARVHGHCIGGGMELAAAWRPAHRRHERPVQHARSARRHSLGDPRGAVR